MNFKAIFSTLFIAIHCKANCPANWFYSDGACYTRKGYFNHGGAMAMCKDKLDAEVYNAPLEPNANKVTQGMKTPQWLETFWLGQYFMYPDGSYAVDANGVRLESSTRKCLKHFQGSITTQTCSSAGVVICVRGYKIHLEGSSFPNAGNLIVTSPNGTSGPVCDDFLLRKDLNGNYYGKNLAQLACRKLGYPGAERFTTGSFFGRVSDDFAMDNVRCAGNERTVGLCKFEREAEDCHSGEGAGVICKKHKVCE